MKSVLPLNYRKYFLNTKQSEREWLRWKLSESEEENEDWLASLGSQVIAMCDEVH